MTQRPLVFLDTETDGLDPRYRQAWEIAFIRIDPNGDREERVFLVAISMTPASSREALEIGGYFDRHPCGRFITGKESPPGAYDVLSPAEAALVVAGFTEGAQIVGAQPSFDTITLSSLLYRHGMKPSWYHRLRDIESMVAGSIQAEPGGLQDCAKLLGVASPEADQHTAMGDARLVEALYWRVMHSDREELERQVARDRPQPSMAEVMADMVGFRIQLAEAGRVVAEGILINVIKDTDFARTTEQVSLVMDDGSSHALRPETTAVILGEGVSAGSID